MNIHYLCPLAVRIDFGALSNERLLVTSADPCSPPVGSFSNCLPENFQEILFKREKSEEKKTPRKLSVSLINIIFILLAPKSYEKKRINKNIYIFLGAQTIPTPRRSKEEPKK